jgi:hypothetical protein
MDPNIYLIGGISTIDGGIKSVDTFTVPSGYKFIIKTIDYSNADRSFLVDNGHYPILKDYQKYFNTIIKSSTESSLLNIELYDDNISVYTDGMQCPNIDYTLFMYDHAYCIPEVNGIVPLHKKDEVCTIEPITSDKINTRYIESLYEHSILPIRHDIVSDALLNINSANKPLLRTWRLSQYIKINQSSLPNKGIYYSLIIINKPRVYLIGGHGNESLTETFIVPKGCTIVAGNPAGVRIHSDDIANLYSSLIVNNTITALRTPSTKEHIKKLDKSINKEITKLKSLVIYKEGDRCPLFTYGLFGLYGNIILPHFNGIIDVDIQKEAIPQLSGIPSSEVTDTSQLSKLYTYSVYPTPDEVLLYSTPKKTWNDNEAIHITQKELCDLYPGVYYNFVCRSIPGIHNDPILRNITGINSINSILSIPNQRVRNTLKKRIIEAEAYRRPLQHLIHSNGGKTKKRNMKKQKTKKRV